MTTYKLERLALCTYELVNTVLASIRVSHFPNVAAIAKVLCPGNPSTQQQWAAYAIGCLKPGFDYLEQVFATTLGDAVKAFKGARLFSPPKVQDIQPTATSISSDLSVSMSVSIL